MDAEDAKKELHKKPFAGSRINIEWSKRSGRGNPGGGGGGGGKSFAGGMRRGIARRQFS